MKYLITEQQYKLLMEEQDVLELPSLDYFGDWETLQKFLKKRGYPPYSINGDLDLRFTDIKSLGNLQYVGGYLDLRVTDIKSLGNLQSVGGYLNLVRTNIESLGNLQYVGGYLDLDGTNIESLENLQSVGGYLDLEKTPLSYIYSYYDIRNIVNVGGSIYI
jgi:hypothetical protein